QLAAVQAAQAQAYHNDMDPSKFNNHNVSVPNHPNTITYEETEDPPTRTMAFFHLLTHQFSIYMTFVLGSLVIAYGIVYDDTQTLRNDVGNHVILNGFARDQCKDLTQAMLVSYEYIYVSSGCPLRFRWQRQCETPSSSQSCISIYCVWHFSLCVASLF